MSLILRPRANRGSYSPSLIMITNKSCLVILVANLKSKLFKFTVNDGLMRNDWKTLIIYCRCGFWLIILIILI